MSPRFVSPRDSCGDGPARRGNMLGERRRSRSLHWPAGSVARRKAAALGSASLRTCVATCLTRRQFFCAFARCTNDENSAHAAAHRSACAIDADPIPYQHVMKKCRCAYARCTRRRSHFYRMKFIPQLCCDQRKIVSQIPAMTLVSVQEKQKMET
jgi:hypothetical protein